MTASEVVDYAHITYRRLDYWCRTGRVPGQSICADGSGINRTFTLAQAKHCRAMGAVAKTGIPLDVAYAIARDAMGGKSVHELPGGLKLFLPQTLVEQQPAMVGES